MSVSHVHAESPPPPPPASARPLPSPSDLSGWYVSLGPVGAAVRIQDNWFAAAGAEVSLVRIRQDRVPAMFGLAAGGVSYASRDGGRLWLELETAVDQPLPVAIGLGAGVTAEADPVLRWRWGGQATLWVFAGVIPYARVGAVEEYGAFVELGIMLKMPVKFRY